MARVCQLVDSTEVFCSDSDSLADYIEVEPSEVVGPTELPCPNPGGDSTTLPQSS